MILSTQDKYMTRFPFKTTNKLESSLVSIRKQTFTTVSYKVANVSQPAEIYKFKMTFPLSQVNCHLAIGEPKMEGLWARDKEKDPVRPKETPITTKPQETCWVY